jgi:hypothetical protein
MKEFDPNVIADSITGKTIAFTQVGVSSVSILFTDGTFLDVDLNTDTLQLDTWTSDK